MFLYEIVCILFAILVLCVKQLKSTACKGISALAFYISYICDKHSGRSPVLDIDYLNLYEVVKKKNLSRICEIPSNEYVELMNYGGF